MTNYFDVKYTESFDVDSSLVDGIYYNRNAGTAVFDLKDDMYEYRGVSYDDVVAVAKASSPGSEFQNFKRKYGPSVYLGNYDDADFDKVESQVLSGNEVRNTGFGLSSITIGPSAANSVQSYYTTGTLGNIQEYYVTFVVVHEGDGAADSFVSPPKTHKISASNPNQAKVAVENLGKPLGLTFKVKEVTVKYND